MCLQDVGKLSDIGILYGELFTSCWLRVVFFCISSVVVAAKPRHTVLVVNEGILVYIQLYLIASDGHAHVAILYIKVK